jgi:hypothetical protein
MFWHFFSRSGGFIPKITTKVSGVNKKVDEMLKIRHHKRSMAENRKNSRYNTLARVKIPGILGEESLLKDLSVTGCCVESTSYAEVQSGVQYKLVIMPESASEIGDFELSVESKWIRAGGYSCEIGFSILESPKGKLFQRYVDYLTWRANANAANSTIV